MENKETRKADGGRQEWNAGHYHGDSIERCYCPRGTKAARTGECAVRPHIRFTQSCDGWTMGEPAVFDIPMRDGSTRAVEGSVVGIGEPLMVETSMGDHLVKRCDARKLTAEEWIG